MVQQVSHVEALPSESLCPLDLLFAAAENTGLLHVAVIQRRDFAILQCLQWSLSIASAHCKHTGPSSQLRNCGFRGQFQQPTPKAAMSVIPVNRVQPLLRCSPARGGHGAALLLVLKPLQTAP